MGLLLVSGMASAQQKVYPGLDVRNVYFSAFIDRYSLRLDENPVEITSVVLSGNAGYWIKEGIGLEIETGLGARNDSVGSLDVEFQSLLAANLRLESPPMRNTSLYLKFGVVRTDFEVSDANINESVTLTGGRAAIGITASIRRGIFVDAAFTHHNYDNDTRINSFRLGLRFDLDS